MEKAKPIEPGCLAMIVGGDPSWFGDVAEVIEKYPAGYYGIGLTIYHADPWMIICEDRKVVAETAWLLRIDDPDIQTQIDRERVLEHV